MVEFDFKIHKKQGTAYFKKEIRKALGPEPKGIPNEASILLYRKDMDIKDVIKSTKNILAVLEHRKELEEKRNE